ncbi:MAG TPA: hypothetical protein PK006_04620 [Saprospiraceae bacterium]|nr:hypothetical protein [Saprospiraceae bacterium]
MKFNLLNILFAIGLISFISFSCNDEHDNSPGSVVLEFDHRWGTQELKLNSSLLTPAGDSVKFTAFRYFISNISFLKADGSEYKVPNSYFLVDHELDKSREITLTNIPADDYRAVQFIIGVDSAKSTTALDQRTGVLDPATGAQGMYWAWNSGYIFIKVEGESPSAPIDSITLKRRFWYHIGGFGGYSSPTINNIKSVSAVSDDDVAHVNGSAEPTFHMIVDLQEFFMNPTNLSIKQNPVVMFAPYSTTIANNYTDMIKLDHIHQ